MGPSISESPEADSLKNKVMELQWQIVKARVLECMDFFAYLNVPSSVYKLPMQCQNFIFLKNWPQILLLCTRLHHGELSSNEGSCRLG